MNKTLKNLLAITGILAFVALGIGQTGFVDWLARHDLSIPGFGTSDPGPAKMTGECVPLKEDRHIAYDVVSNRISFMAARSSK